MKLLKKVIEILVFIMTGKSDDMVDAGLCDYSGQGRNEYGK